MSEHGTMTLPSSWVGEVMEDKEDCVLGDGLGTEAASSGIYFG